MNLHSRFTSIRNIYNNILFLAATLSLESSSLDEVYYYRTNGY